MSPQSPTLPSISSHQDATRFSGLGFSEIPTTNFGYKSSSPKFVVGRVSTVTNLCFGAQLPFRPPVPHAKPNDPWPIADKLPNVYQGVLVVVVVVAVMPNDYHMVVVAVVVAVMPIGLRKSAGRKEHKQDKC
jgi:hypothetical protein